MQSGNNYIIIDYYLLCIYFIEFYGTRSILLAISNVIIK